MYRPNNPGGQSHGGESSPYGGHGGDMGGMGGPGMGGPFRSPMRPRYQSSPRYHPQFGSPFPDPYRMPSGGGGGMRPQRSPHHGHSPRHDYNQSPGNIMDAQYHHGNNRRMSTPRGEGSGGRRGRGGRHNRHSGNRDFHSSNTGGNRDNNPGGCDDITMYYHPDMVKDPWANMMPVPYTETT